MYTCLNCNHKGKNTSAHFCGCCGQILPLDGEVFHLQKLQQIYLRHLHVLEEQFAYFGPHTPSHVILGIEDLRIKITNLAQQISFLTIRTRNEISDSFLELRFQKQKTQNAPSDIKILEISLLTGILPENIQLTKSDKDYFVLRIQAPNSIIQQLLSRFYNNDPDTSNLKKHSEVINQSNNVYGNIDRINTLCKCKTYEKLFTIYFLRDKEDRWLAYDVDSEINSIQSNQRHIKIRGLIDTDKDFPGCPHCYSKGLFKHVECGRLSCWTPGSSRAFCVWCKSHFSVTATINDLDGLPSSTDTG